MNCLVETLESRRLYSVSGPAIVAAQAAIVTAETAARSDLTILDNRLESEDASIYAAATKVKGTSATLLAKIHTDVNNARQLFQARLTKLNAGVSSATATAANDAANGGHTSAAAKKLLADEKALAAAVGIRIVQLRVDLASETVANELVTVRNANGDKPALVHAITTRIKDSAALRAKLSLAVEKIKTKVEAFRTLLEGA